LTNSKIIRRREVCERVGLSYSTIWRYEQQGLFPQRVQLNPNATGMTAVVGWRSDEVDEWIYSRLRVAGRRSAKSVTENGQTV
jgi:predicted DNA-binding transcriptional regulator AlpA